LGITVETSWNKWNVPQWVNAPKSHSKTICKSSEIVYNLGLEYGSRRKKSVVGEAINVSH